MLQDDFTETVHQRSVNTVLRCLLLIQTGYHLQQIVLCFLKGRQSISGDSRGRSFCRVVHFWSVLTIFSFFFLGTVYLERQLLGVQPQVTLNPLEHTW